MYLIDNPTAAASLPTPDAPGTPGYFTDGSAGSGEPATILPADFMNMLMMELTNVVTGGGLTPSKTTYNQVLLAIKALIAQPQTNLVSGVVGQTRNLVMNVATASASATLTADEIVVETALGGLRYCLASFNKTINLATTGAGGMDTGSAPASGFVGLYAIYNPTTQTTALLATNTTGSPTPNVYGGANMPSGYTASALVGVWPTNASSQFPIATQQDRSFWYATQIQAIITATQQSTLTPLNINSAVPSNAKTCTGTAVISSSSAATLQCAIAGGSAGQGQNNISAGQILSTNGSYNVPVLVASRLIYFLANVSAGSMSLTITVGGYTI